METNIDDRQLFIAIIEQQSASDGINGRYYNVSRLDDCAGQGNFSLVFKADDRSNGKKVALKFFNPLENDEYRRRCFYRESDILESLRGQSNIIQLVEPRSAYIIRMTHEPTGMVWPLTLEFISTDLASSNIKQYIYETETQPLKSLVYFREMCKGVQRIHVRQICHRDLKLDNFFIIGRGNICLGDFGSSRCFGSSGQALVEIYPIPNWRGEIFYTAPEMFGLAAEDAESFRRADIYSLGASLFEMFTKQKLYPYVFDERFNSQIFELTKYGLGNLPLAGERLRQIVTQIVQDVRLPEIYDFDTDVPIVIRERLNNLYKGMANLDYKRRICDSQVVFREVNHCIEVLQNRVKYERWMELKKLWNERRKQRIEKRQSTQNSKRNT
jgi:serine/threonine protein kinase